MRKTISVFILMTLILVLGACGGRKRLDSVSNQSDLLAVDQVKHSGSSFWDKFVKNMRSKKISPEMEVELEELMSKGCVPDYKILESDTAYLYSIIPGGGQIYTGETKKAFMYLLGSFLVVPYIVSFEDAQKSVDYQNAKYAIDFCNDKFRFRDKKKVRAENERFLGETRLDTNLKEKNRKFMEQLMRGQRAKSIP